VPEFERQSLRLPSADEVADRAAGQNRGVNLVEHCRRGGPVAASRDRLRRRVTPIRWCSPSATCEPAAQIQARADYAKALVVNEVAAGRC